MNFHPSVNPHEVNTADMINAVHYLFIREVAAKISMNTTELAALADWCESLAKVSSISMQCTGQLTNLDSYVQQTLTSVSAWARSRQSATAADYARLLNDVENELWPNFTRRSDFQWQSCRGSSRRYRGYPCALWMLAHAASVASYEQSRE